MEKKNFIDITGVDLVKLTQKVYELSRPFGLGFLHYEEGGLSKKEAQKIVDIWKNDIRFALCLDYVKGRACKLNVWKESNKLYIRKKWYDHSESDLEELLKEIKPIATKNRKEAGVNFWIDREFKFRLWFGKTYYKGKYNWIDFMPYDKEELKISGHFIDKGIHEVFIQGKCADYKLVGRNKDDFRVSKYDGFVRKMFLPSKNRRR